MKKIINKLIERKPTFFDYFIVVLSPIMVTISINYLNNAQETISIVLAWAMTGATIINLLAYGIIVFVKKD